MAENTRPLSRKQLAKFLPDQESIRLFEQLMSKVQETIPTDIEGIELAAGTASAESKQALSSIESIIENEVRELLLSSYSAESKASEIEAYINRISNLVQLGILSPKNEQKQLDNIFESLLLSQNKEPDRFANLDYIDFVDGPHLGKQQRMQWNADDGTIDVGLYNGVVLQAGQETLAYVLNDSGASIANGSAVMVTGSDATSGKMKVDKLVSDGSVEENTTLGVATQTIDDGEFGYIATFGIVRGVNTNSWISGDILYADPATAGGLTSTKPSAPDNVIPMAIVLAVGTTDGSMFVRPTITQQQYYGSFYDTTDQTPAVINTAYAITWNTTQISSGVSIGTPTSRIYIDNAGFYTVTFSAQLTSGSSSAKNGWFWPRINGVDVANSAMKVTVISNAETKPLNRAMTFSFSAGDYVEAMWAADDINMMLDASASTAFAPASPSVIMTVAQTQQ